MTFCCVVCDVVWRVRTNYKRSESVLLQSGTLFYGVGMHNDWS